MKILIHYKENEIKPIGGPAGYLYNLKYMRDICGDQDVFFLNESLYVSPKWADLRDRLFRFIQRRRIFSQRARHIRYLLYKSSKREGVDFSQFDIIHFHSTFDMYSQKARLEKYRGVVLLTSHSPKVAYREFIDDYATEEEYLKYKRLFDSAEKFDLYAFQRADYVIYPCVGAEEPYYHSWDKYVNVRKEEKIKYLLTGTLQEQYSLTKECVREKLGIPDDAFVLSFVGRHKEVKGYDLLIELFNKLENVYVVCCGSQSEIKPPSLTDRWIEVGWTDDAYSYVNAADVFVLPNRETYFDLSLIQTLSIGKLSLISLTGGNKYFEGKEQQGIFTYSSLEEAVSKIEYIKSLDTAFIAKLEENQREYFIKEFDVSIFYSNYRKVLTEICIERGKG